MVVVYLPVTAFRSILPQLTEGIWPMVDEEDSFPSFVFTRLDMKQILANRLQMIASHRKLQQKDEMDRIKNTYMGEQGSK